VNSTEPSATPDTPRPCEHCGRLTDRWQWRLIENYPTALYEASCPACVIAQDLDFTAEGAIAYACIIIGVHQGALAQKARMR